MSFKKLNNDISNGEDMDGVTELTRELELLREEYHKKGGKIECIKYFNHAAWREKGNKYLMHMNENMSIGFFKECMLEILLEPEKNKRIKKLNELQEEMERYVLPIRELPGKERRKNISNKYITN